MNKAFEEFVMKRCEIEQKLNLIVKSLSIKNLNRVYVFASSLLKSETNKTKDKNS